jgi:hypothetical protein
MMNREFERKFCVLLLLLVPESMISIRKVEGLYKFILAKCSLLLSITRMKLSPHIELSNS